ncbi:hypothetical protein OG738_03540 [Amycolatopsis sp. NBC_01488]|uniref:hypothetical protein n=1 Tax=Amycolatopsis sp. NBC_01488 TaxID=2903563 RepID=UPI002E2CDEEA|nr:hypothetical protein [Amycolatopsis sp. NBC_01488]
MRFTKTAAVALAVLPTLAGVSAAAAAPPPPTDTVSPQIVGGDPAPVAYAGAGSLQLLDHGDPNWHSCGLTFLAEGYTETGALAAHDLPVIIRQSAIRLDETTLLMNLPLTLLIGPSSPALGACVGRRHLPGTRTEDRTGLFQDRCFRPDTPG